MLPPRSPALTIRSVGADEWRLWRSIRLAALAEAPEAFGSKLAQWQGAGDREERWRARLSSVPFNVVALLGERPAGIVSGTDVDEGGSVELISLWVAPFARGRGAGDALVGAVVDWARRQRAERLALDVTAGNERAQALYARHGFHDDGPIDGGAERRMVLTL